MELLAVGLNQCDPVLPPLEYLHLVHREDVGPGEVSLSVDVHCAVESVQSDDLVEIRVLFGEGHFNAFFYPYNLYLEYNEGNPDLT